MVKEPTPQVPQQPRPGRAEEPGLEVGDDAKNRAEADQRSDDLTQPFLKVRLNRGIHQVAHLLGHQDEDTGPGQKQDGSSAQGPCIWPGQPHQSTERNPRGGALLLHPPLRSHFPTASVMTRSGRSGSATTESKTSTSIDSLTTTATEPRWICSGMLRPTWPEAAPDATTPSADR